MKIGIVKETKSPPDKRVPLIPEQVSALKKKFKEIEIVVQSSSIRGYTDIEYVKYGIPVVADISDCDILIGIKEVDIESLVGHKTYLFFSHTAKKQPHNKKLLQKILKKGITLIDYEYLTNADQVRLVAFGHWAGIVGAYNGLIAFGKHYNLFSLKPAYKCFDMNELKAELQKVKLPPIKILITGGGRVASGAKKILDMVGIKKILPEDYINKEYRKPVYAQIEPQHYVKRRDGKSFVFNHFIKFPSAYKSTFSPYTKRTDLFIACHFWDIESPVFITKEEMKADDFKIKVIADISCDINGPIPSTIRASSISHPFYGYNPIKEIETPPFEKNSITVMAVDNLPGELPRDASKDFGDKLSKHIIPLIIEGDNKSILENATICQDGKLTEAFSYLENYVNS